MSRADLENFLYEMNIFKMSKCKHIMLNNVRFKTFVLSLWTFGSD